jgi:uncharacterized protein (TIGR03437 family)
MDAISITKRYFTSRSSVAARMNGGATVLRHTPGVISGLTQVNVQIPAGLVPISVQFGSVSTQPNVSIAVSGK